MLDGSGVRITSGEELAEIVLAGAEAGLPGRGARDRRRREPRGARRVRADARGLGAARAAPPDRARAAARAGGPPPLRRARRRLLGAVLARALGPRPRRPLLGRARPTAPTPTARSSTRARVVANGSDAPIEELDPLAGIRAGVRRTIDDAAGLASRAGADRAAGVRGDDARARLAHAATSGARGKLLPGYAADLVVLDRDPWDDLDAEVVATMVAGRWVHNPPPWTEHAIAAAGTVVPPPSRLVQLPPSCRTLTALDCELPPSRPADAIRNRPRGRSAH